jgi:hypothetical protein
MAERGGFEPPIRFCRIHTFQACAFNHSATSPCGAAPSLAARRGSSSRYFGKCQAVPCASLPANALQPWLLFQRDARQHFLNFENIRGIAPAMSGRLLRNGHPAMTQEW